MANRRARVLHRQTARGHAFVRAVRGAGRQHVYVLRIQHERLRCDPLQRMQDALPQLHLAGEHAHAAIGFETQPR